MNAPTSGRPEVMRRRLESLLQLSLSLLIFSLDPSCKTEPYNPVGFKDADELARIKVHAMSTNGPDLDQDEFASRLGVLFSDPAHRLPQGRVYVSFREPRWIDFAALFHDLETHQLYPIDVFLETEVDVKGLTATLPATGQKFELTEACQDFRGVAYFRVSWRGDPGPPTLTYWD